MVPLSLFILQNYQKVVLFLHQISCVLFYFRTKLVKYDSLYVNTFHRSDSVQGTDYIATHLPNLRVSRTKLFSFLNRNLLPTSLLSLFFFIQSSQSLEAQVFWSSPLHYASLYRDTKDTDIHVNTSHSLSTFTSVFVFSHIYPWCYNIVNGNKLIRKVSYVPIALINTSSGKI